VPQRPGDKWPPSRQRRQTAWSRSGDRKPKTTSEIEVADRETRA
jgi:hypothetical protein